MLNFDVKRKINTLRDILVGKVPDPKAQVEQITIALIYKFMDDMDLVGTWGRNDVALSYTFYVPVDATDPTPVVKKETAFTFTQSKSELHYIPVASPNKFEDLDEGKFYYRDWKGQNLIYWKEDDYLLAVQGNYDNAFLEQIAGYVIEQKNPLE